MRKYLPKGLTYMSFIRTSEGEEKEIRQEKNVWRNSDQKLPKFGNRDKFTDSRSLANSKRIHSEKTMPRHIIFKLINTKGKD